MRFLTAFAAAGAMLAMTTTAMAHPALVKTAPAADGVVTGSPADIRLTFSEAPVPKFSGAVITDAAGAKVATGAPSIAKTEAKQLVVPVKAALKPGAYKVEWFAVAGDTHRVTGKYSFTVK